MTDRLRNMILNLHNDARRRVAKGEEPNKVGKLNPAKNMYKMVSFFREKKTVMILYLQSNGKGKHSILHTFILQLHEAAYQRY